MPVATVPPMKGEPVSVALPSAAATGKSEIQETVKPLAYVADKNGRWCRVGAPETKQGNQSRHLARPEPRRLIWPH